jgi:predicted RNA-binding Zn-ribbon protein involved in translation (DUF1610 family)
MKTHHHILKSTAALLLAMAIAAGSLYAGPGALQVYAPVKTHAEAEALKPNTKIAVTCPACGAVSTSVVDKSKSHLHSFTCTMCKHSFEIEPVAGGKATSARLVCKDTATGKKMPLQMCAEMHGR